MSSNGAKTVPYNGLPLSNVGVVPASLVIFDAVASFSLAIFLLLTGVLILRGSPNGRRLLLIYAGSKVPVAVIGASAGAWMCLQILSGLGPTTLSIASSNPFFVKMALLECIYPVALLIDMNTPRMRAYYRERCITSA